MIEDDEEYVFYHQLAPGEQQQVVEKLLQHLNLHIFRKPRYAYYEVYLKEDKD